MNSLRSRSIKANKHHTVNVSSGSDSGVGQASGDSVPTLQGGLDLVPNDRKQDIDFIQTVEDRDTDEARREITQQFRAQRAEKVNDARRKQAIPFGDQVQPQGHPHDTANADNGIHSLLGNEWQGSNAPVRADAVSRHYALLLDEERLQCLEGVERKNTDVQKHAARRLNARLTSESGRLRAEESKLGSGDFLAGVERSGWCPWARTFHLGSLGAVLLDTGSWYLCAMRELSHVSGLLLVFLALGAALVGKFVGRYFAGLLFSDPASGEDTVERHLRTLLMVSVATGLFALATVVFFLAGSTEWLIGFGWIPLVGMNMLLAALAGTSSSLSSILGKPIRSEEIQYELSQCQHLQHALYKYLVVLSMMVVACVGSARAAGKACGLFFDDRISLDEVDRKKAMSFAIESVDEQTEHYGCSWVVAGTLGPSVRFAPRTWLAVPVHPETRNCEAVEPDPLKGHGAFVGEFKRVHEERKKHAIETCKEEEAQELTKFTAASAGFTRDLRAALAVRPRRGGVRIRDYVLYAARGGLYRSIVVVTDLVDPPGSELDRIVLPSGTAVTLVVVRPNPQYVSLAEAVARAREWEKVPGVRVVTTGELRPGLWADLSKAR